MATVQRNERAVRARIERVRRFFDDRTGRVFDHEADLLVDRPSFLISDSLPESRLNQISGRHAAARSAPGRISAVPTLHFLIAVSLPLFAMLACAKAMSGGLSWMTLRFPVRLALLEVGDFFFVVGWATASAALMVWTDRLPPLRRLVRWGLISASTLFLVYGIANIWMLSAFGMPLTYPMILMAGDLSDVRSSIACYVTLPAILTLIGSPLVYLGLVYAGLRSRSLGSARARIAIAVIVSVYCSAGVYGYSRFVAGGDVDGIARNPHWAMLRSFVDQWRGNSSAALGETGPASYREDFQVAGNRPGSATTALAASPIRNVIVVVLESAGTQFLSLYGSKFQTTPNLEAEAKNSLIFRNVQSNDCCTVYSMMPMVLSIYPGNGWTAYASEYPHLTGTSAAQVLQDRGSRTAFMTSGTLDFMGDRHFFENRGFDVAWGCEDFIKHGVGTMTSSWGMDDVPMFDQVLQWIDAGGKGDQAKPFYLMAWTVQTHHPYPAAPNQQMTAMSDDETREGELLNRYLNNLRLADQQLGRLFAALRERHLDRNTLVVVTGDHGEAFGSPHPWHSHGTALYQECVNVPCIFWSPALFSPGARSEVVGAHVDLNPTIFDLMGLPAPASWQGFSLLDPKRPPRSYFACCTGNLLEGMRQGNDKFIYNLTMQREELYDLATDPTEQHNEASERPAQCKTYRDRLAAWATFEKGHLSELIAGKPGS